MFTQLDGRHPRRWDGDDSTVDGDDHDFGEEAGWKTSCFSLCGKFSRNLRSRGRRTQISVITEVTGADNQQDLDI